MKYMLVVIVFVGTCNAGDSVESLFNNAIRRAKETCSIKSFGRNLDYIKKCIATQTTVPTHECDTCLIQELTTDKNFEAYIERPAEQTTFTERHEPVITNQYEKKLYKSLGKDGAACRYYVDKDEKASFYTVFLENNARLLLTERLKAAFAQSDTIEVHDLGDNISRMRYHVDSHANIAKDQYHVGAYKQFNHLMASVIKYSAQHKPITFVLNSEDSETVNYMLEPKFNLGYKCIGNPELCDRYLKTWREKLPFVDVSHHLQRKDPSRRVDHNCGLYTYDFAHAAASYLTGKNTQQFNKACNQGDYAQAADLLREGMKPHLPMYYDCAHTVCTEKPRIDIEKYHRNVRWDISGQIIMSELKKKAMRKKQS